MRVCCLHHSSIEDAAEAFVRLHGVAGCIRLVEKGDALPEVLAPGEIGVVIYDDANMDEQHRVQAWQAGAGAAVQLTARLRGALVTWRYEGDGPARGARVLIHGPDDLTAEALEAVAEFALLDHALSDSQTTLEGLQIALLEIQDTPELARRVSEVRAAYNMATRERLAALRLVPYFETPARTGPAGPKLRLRTELTVQALMEDALLHQLQIYEALHTTVEQELQQTHEQRRARLEKYIGFVIIAILLMEGALILYDTLIYDLIFGTLPPLP